MVMLLITKLGQINGNIFAIFLNIDGTLSRPSEGASSRGCSVSNEKCFNYLSFWPE